MRKIFTFFLVTFLCASLNLFAQQYTQSDYASTTTNTAVTINVMANDIGFSPNYCVVINNSGAVAFLAPQHGTVTVSGQSIIYQPNQGFVGTDVFVYGVSVCGTTNVIDTADVTVTVVQDSTTGCQAYFSYQTGSSGQVYFFGYNQNSNPGDSLNYYWNFGNGTTSNQQNPVITFTNSIVNVCLTIATANNCTSTYCDTLFINNTNCNIVISGSVTPATNANTANGAISTTNATFPITYQWNNGATTQGLNGLFPGLYTVTVTDNANCSNSATFNVYPLDSTPSFTVSVSTVNSSSNACNGAATLYFYNGTAPFIVQFSGMSYTTMLSSLTLDSLCPGMYTVTVYDNMQNSYTLTFAIGSSTNPDTNLVVTVSTENADYNMCNGTAYLSVVGGYPPYSYQVFASNSSTPVSISDLNGNLCPGTYTVVVNDSLMNQATVSFIIYEGAINPNDTILWVDVLTGIGQNVPPTCNGYAYANIYGGTAPFSYLWSNGVAAQNLTNLCPGYYCVTVTDANGLTAYGCASLDSIPSTNIPTDTLSSQVDTCIITAPIDSAWVNSVSTDSNGVVTGVWIITVNGQAYTIIVPYNITAPGTYNMVLVINCIGGAKTLYVLNTNYTVTPEELNMTGCNEVRADNILVYPNPVKDYLYLNCENAPVSVSLYTIQGSLVFNANNVNKTLSIPVTGLADGAYVLKITNTDGTIIVKRILK